MRICVFCGSSYGNKPAYKAAAQALGTAMAERGIGLVYGGAAVGLMGTVADAALLHQGDVLGVIPKQLANLELSHPGLTDLKVVGSMHERKLAMADAASAFIALPGGLGTLEELFEALTWTQLGIHRKPVGLFNVDGYYDKLLSFLNDVAAEGFIRPEHRTMLVDKSNADELLDALAAVKLPAIPKWVDDPAKLR